MNKKKIEYYKEVQTLEEWTETIETKFSDFPLIRKNNELTIETTLAITNPIEIEKIKKAQLIVYARKLGVETFESACKKLNIDYKKHLRKIKELSEGVQSFSKLEIIIKVLQEDWKPDFNNDNQKKYYPYFKIDKSVSSCCFVYVDYSWVDWYVDTVWSRLCLPTAELAYFVGNYYIGLYKMFLLI